MCMKASEICVIHLSDLHFQKGKVSSVYDDLLEDIKHQIRYDDCILIVVTGDFATKGQVKESHSEIVEFFRRLANVIPQSATLLDVEIVPGNHDVDRPTFANKYHDSTYYPKNDGYRKLSCEIYDAFNAFGIVQKSESGVSFVPYKGKHIAFVRLDTSAFSTVEEWKQEIVDDFNKNNIDITDLNDEKVLSLVAKRKAAFTKQVKAQRFETSEEYKQERAKINNEAPFLTFAISHHPLTLLNTTGFDELADILFKHGLSFVNAIICGHKHKAQLSYTLDNAQQMIMLMSGVGWQETQDTIMRYSIYRICLERNMCQVSVRKASEGHKFGPDSSIGDSSDKEFSRTMQYMLPLKSTKVGSVISLTARQNEMAKGLYVDQETILLIPRVAQALSEARLAIETYVSESIVKVQGKVFSKKESYAEVMANWSMTLNKQRTKIHNRVAAEISFRQFLTKMCMILVKGLYAIEEVYKTEYSDGSKSNDSKVDWRIHYRMFKGLKLKEYKASKDLYVAQAAWGILDGEIKETERPSDMIWGGLIKGSYECVSHMMINSAVPGLNTKKDTRWSDFMTLCPNFRGSKLSLVKKDSNKNETRPILTFGISYKVDDIDSLQHAAKVLYLLEYLDLSGFIEKSIDAYSGAFKLSGHQLRNMLAESACAKLTRLLSGCGICP